MTQHNGNDHTGEPCAYCGRPIDIVHYRLRPGSGASGDPDDLERVPFCSEDWIHLSEGHLPPRPARAAGSLPLPGLTTSRAAILVVVTLSAALMLLLVWWLVSLVLA